MITFDQARSIFPKGETLLSEFLVPLSSAMVEFRIDTPLRQAAFLAQVAHESAELTRRIENLNYSADGLAATWPDRFLDKKTGKPNAFAQSLQRNPEAIANYVYASRMGNGPEATGDGWKFRGRGLIQITGKSNYMGCSQVLFGDTSTLQRFPELLEKPKDACRSAAWFWQWKKLNQYADTQNMERITRIINGGLNGLDDRLKYYRRAKIALGVA